MGDLVLVVDDELGVRESVRLLLEPEFSVEAVANVDEAIAALGRRRPALVLLDLAMPRRSGFDLLLHLGETGDPTPVIVVSATRSITIAVDAMKAGAVDFLLKPFGAEELRGRIRAGLATARKGRRTRRRTAASSAFATGKT